MTTSGPEQPYRATGYPSPENAGSPLDPNAPVDYPADAGLPPQVYPTPYPGAPGYPAAPTYPPPGYYGAGYDPYPPTKPPGTNGKAIAALVTSLVGLMCCGLPSIAGLILGIMGMLETKRTGQDGYAIALIGVIFGGLAVAGWVLYLLLSIGLYASSWRWAR
jgi:hypothetical protein